jgi:hypothetical protein
MISGVDIDDWNDEDYLKVMEDIPPEKRKVKISEVDDTLVLSLENLITEYGKSLHKKFKKFYNL